MLWTFAPCLGPASFLIERETFFVQVYMCPELVDGELNLAPGFPSPPNSDYEGYHKYIDHALPGESPYLCGLHPNAEIGYLTSSAEHLFRIIFELQPRDLGAAVGVIVSREDKVRRGHS